jgi:hypothetical protein
MQGFGKKPTASTDLPSKQSSELKNVTAKGIAGKGGSLQAGSPLKQGSLKGFGKGGQVKP